MNQKYVQMFLKTFFYVPNQATIKTSNSSSYQYCYKAKKISTK
jgi:hypothetical protein